MRRRGFTLLEVMVAVAILGLALTAIFSSEAGAIRMASRSGKMGMAALMARCKMGEIEEQIDNEGLPAIDAGGTDGCCEGAELDGFECDWEIKPVILPDTMFAPEEGEEGEEGEPGEDGSGEEPDTPAFDPAGGVNVPLGALSADPQDILSGGGTGDLASMAMGFIYPVLKPSFEAQIRRATVTVKWKEGSAEKSFDVTQYLVANQGVALELGEEEGEAEGEPGTGTGTGLNPFQGLTQ